MEDFTQIGEVEVTTEQAPAKAEKKAKHSAIEKAFLDKVRTDADYAASLHTRSDDIVVTKSLGMGKEGSLVVNKDDPYKKDANGNFVLNKEGKRVRNYVKVPKIVGYMIKNVSAQPVPYKTTKATLGADGVWTETVVDAVLAPGQEVAIPKRYLTALAARPEFALQLKNGIMKKSSTIVTANASIDEEFEAYHFASNEGIAVNSDEFKISISTAQMGADGKEVYKVKPEFEGIFGVLNNTVETTKATTAKKSNYKKSDAAAFYLQSLLEKSNGQI